jgi:hypothetical protein
LTSWAYRAIIVVFDMDKVYRSERVEKCARLVDARRVVRAADPSRMGFVPVVEKNRLIVPVSPRSNSVLLIVCSLCCVLAFTGSCAKSKNAD